MDISDFVKMTGKAWVLPILGQMAQGVPGRQATLCAATGAGRTALGHSLGHLMALGLLERTPGHGHPLRSEVRLTARGLRVAPFAAQIAEHIKTEQQAVLLRRMWSLPTLVVALDPVRFGTLKGALAPITDRALSQGLRQLEGVGWVDRRVETSARPPRPIYRAVGAGFDLGSDAMRLMAAS